MPFSAAAEIMSNRETAGVQLLQYIDFVRTAAHNNNPQLPLRFSGPAGNMCTVSAEDVSTVFWEAKILSPYSLHVFPDPALLKPFHFWV